jgi:beta-1,4-mannosyltransferase
MRILASPAFSNRQGNPYNWLLYTHMEALDVETSEFSYRRMLLGSYDLWHIHWPETLLSIRNPLRALARLARLLTMIEVARRRGIKIVWTVHNLAAHEERHERLAFWFRKAFARRLDGYISLTAAGQELAVAAIPELKRVPAFVVPHGHYRGVYPEGMTRKAARDRLNIHREATVAAFVGQVRRYKGVLELSRVFSETADGRARLLIAGEQKDDGLASELRAQAAADPRIRLHLDVVPVPNEDLQMYLGAADLIVLPFRRVLNSGSALLALSFDRPILVPETGPFAELRERVGDVWVRTYDRELTPSVLAAAMEWARAWPRASRPALGWLDWSEVARQTAEALARVIGSSGPRASVPDISRPAVGS